MSASTDDYTILSATFVGWWRGLQSLGEISGQEIRIGGKPKSPDRAALAELRRIDVTLTDAGPAVDVARALAVPAFRDLVTRLQRADFADGSRVMRRLVEDHLGLEPLAIAAATLARVRADAGGGRGATAALLGEGIDDKRPKPRFAEARFKRLIRCRNDWADLMAQARRVAAILEREAPVGDLGASLVLWNDGPRITRDWAFAYYQRAGAAPDDSAPADIGAPALPAASPAPGM